MSSDCLLYQEVADLCIDFLDDSDAGYKALCRCLLVSHSFLQRSRPRVFSTLNVYTDTNTNHATSWVTIMERIPLLRRLLEFRYLANSLPPLASCVNALVLDYVNPFIYQQFGFDASYGDLTTIFSLLRDGSKIQSFALKIHHPEGPFSPVPFPKHIHEDLQSFFCTPSMESLVIHGAGRLPLSLLGGPALKHLEIKRTLVSFPTEDECLPDLRSLSCKVYGIPDDLPRWYSQIGTTQLHRLRFLKTVVPYYSNFRQAQQDIQWMLDNSHSSLKSFIFQFHSSPRDPVPFSLGKLGAIQSICFVVVGKTSSDLAGERHMMFNGIELVNSSLASFASAPMSLQAITISLKCCCRDQVILSGIREEDFGHWRDLDATLTGPNLKSLKRIQISVQVQKSSPDLAGTLPISSRLPILMSGLWDDSRFTFTIEVMTTDLFDPRELC